ncbi:MAG: aminodeoxychorismate/anthranilate synthase component II [Gammaproteobacteria bacterium]|nr:aminodeoxychorismate/anthranilate synthase component II [Pseudomonadota bacterium]MCZ6536632.1 aminodeoxychorismate/anthranilate synthase component II [Gammaproteobacteria bacterium]MCZ6686460.1 aminodeoxychorismate/anthranilate synthase component II [Gammaproteobacteria bacterium]MCZ6762294.1 aminodeoxychorismate/anthranilate synthase component II [Gammaproteobacteria bacterium]MCZ6880875.1 aminodeoxychorismate/anthranilate synthase component II [Gammaproteobacteria bacterium]
MLLMIDNYDSFTYNLVQYFGELGEDVQVHRNDKISVADIRRRSPDYLVISPGPCTPERAGISVQAVRELAGEMPILGVCLGHQSIAEAFGGKTIHASAIMHGKPSRVWHDGHHLYRGIEQPLEAARYHSLIVDADSLPDCLEVTAWTRGDDGANHEIMGLRHRELPIQGVQFHPESILTRKGHALLRNFLSLEGYARDRRCA